VPYRIDFSGAAADTLDKLIELGALDIEAVGGDGMAAIMPDSVTLAHVEQALGRDDIRVAPARGRDDDSVWVVHLRRIEVGQLEIVPAERATASTALRMVDGPAFGTGLHPTTALCLERLAEELTAGHRPRVLDVGTGCGVLALAALRWGALRAVALELDTAAVRVASENARLNGLSSRLHLVQGGPEALSGCWQLVVANILAAPLMAMAPTLARRVGHHGQLIVSGIRSSLARDVEQAYRRVGMQPVREERREGWTALTLRAPW
jgi:ribosomal protein L11 methyltransferase